MYICGSFSNFYGCVSIIIDCPFIVYLILSSSLIVSLFQHMHAQEKLKYIVNKEVFISSVHSQDFKMLYFTPMKCEVTNLKHP